MKLTLVKKRQWFLRAIGESRAARERRTFCEGRYSAGFTEEGASKLAEFLIFGG
jgi:hypothetical protein